MTIGFDNPGTTAYSWFMREGKDIDIGFLKVLFTEAPPKLLSIPQQTPYHDSLQEQSAGKQKEQVKAAMPSMILAPDEDVVWGSVMFSVIQLRIEDDY